MSNNIARYTAPKRTPTPPESAMGPPAALCALYQTNNSKHFQNRGMRPVCDRYAPSPHTVFRQHVPSLHIKNTPRHFYLPLPLDFYILIL
jgi:hypothetical protein